MITHKEYYQKNGYVIIPNLVNPESIKSFFTSLEEFKNNNFLYYSQSEHNWRRIQNDLDENGLISSSFENFTNLIWSKNLSKAGREILQSNSIHKILKDLSGENQFCMWQNMLFDKSTGTVDHLDTWYLDTDPMGKLIAAWIALEDIDGKGGSFHVYPGSHKENSLDWIGTSHEDYVTWCNNLTKKYKRKEALLKKGDVLFWHPSLIHGATLQNKKGKSRKSLTAHYFPTNYLMGGSGKNSEYNSSDYRKKLLNQNNKLRSYGYPILSSYSRKKSFFFSVKGLIKYYFKLNKKKMLMNRSTYDIN